MTHLNRELAKLSQGSCLCVFTACDSLASGQRAVITLGVGGPGRARISLFFRRTSIHFLEAARKRPNWASRAERLFCPTVPQVFINVDRDRVPQAGRIHLGPSLSDSPGLHGRIPHQLLQLLRKAVAGLHPGGWGNTAPTRNKVGTVLCAK